MPVREVQQKNISKCSSIIRKKSSTKSSVRGKMSERKVQSEGEKTSKKSPASRKTLVRNLNR
jgi:hypothetical protein